MASIQDEIPVLPNSPTATTITRNAPALPIASKCLVIQLYQSELVQIDIIPTSYLKANLATFHCYARNGHVRWSGLLFPAPDRVSEGGYLDRIACS
jgi:hypothetical protein